MDKGFRLLLEAATARLLQVFENLQKVKQDQIVWMIQDISHKFY
jgi:hypothetical protein